MKQAHVHHGQRQRAYVQALVLACLAATLVSGCATPAAMQQARYTPRQGVPSSIPLKGPLDLRLDFVYPERSTLHSLTWSKGECAWSVDLPGDDGACAGVVFRKAYDLSAAPTDALVSFKMKASQGAQHIILSLLDEVATESGTLLSYREVRHRSQLDAYVVRQKGDWAYVEIPLEAFFAPHTGARPDWSNIRGLRLSHASDAPGGRITLKDFGFLHEGRRNPHDYASVL